MKKKRKILIIIIVGVLVLIGSLFIIYRCRNNNTFKNTNNFYIVYVKEEFKDLDDNSTVFIDNQNKFDEYIDELEDYDKELDFHNHDYLLYNFVFSNCGEKINGFAINNFENNVLTIDVDYYSSIGPCARSKGFYLIELDKGLAKTNPQVVFNYIDSYKHKKVMIVLYINLLFMFILKRI